MSRERERMNLWRHGVMTALRVSNAASRTNGATGDIPQTREFIKRPVANGTAIPATVSATRRGE